MKKEIQELIFFAEKKVKNDYIITNGYDFTFEEIKLLQSIEFDSTKLSQAFEGRLTKNTYAYYSVELICTKCGNKCVEEMSKTSLINLIKDYSNKYGYDYTNFVCKDCNEKEEKLKQESYVQQKLKESILIKNNTVNYIQKFLTPNFSDKINYREWSELNEYYVNREEIAKIIKALKYADFLTTLYWQLIANKKRYQANFKCQLCSSTGILHVHHSTYANHGHELENMKDLIVLCDKCHSTFHLFK